MVFGLGLRRGEWTAEVTDLSRVFLQGEGEVDTDFHATSEYIQLPLTKMAYESSTPSTGSRNGRMGKLIDPGNALRERSGGQVVMVPDTIFSRGSSWCPAILIQGTGETIGGE